MKKINILNLNIVKYLKNNKNKRYLLKIFINFIFILFFSFFLFIRNIKVCICTYGKKENLYIREFVEHYKNYSVDKIFLYDNNEIGGEHFEDVINDYIETKYVDLYNFRGKQTPLMEILNDCYKKNYKNYDWLIFYEIDEFLYIKDINNIKDFLQLNRFKNWERIQLNWIFHTDNNQLFYVNRTLKERFPEREKKARGVKKGDWNGIKSILRGHIPNMKIECVHTINHKLKSCDGFGNPKKIDRIITRPVDFYNYYIDHYYCKSTEEFINKINKGDTLYGNKSKIPRIKTYFSYNKITKEKIDLIENGTGFNLSEYRKFIKNQK